MKRRRILLLFALAAVAVAVILFWPRGPKEPVFEGRRLGLWLNEALGPTPEAQDQAEWAAKRAVRAVCTNALPWLMSEFTRTEPTSREALHSWVNKIIGRRSVLTAKDFRLAMAARGLAFLGSDLAPALPELAKILGDQDPKRVLEVGWLMSHAGEQALPYLLRGLASRNMVAEMSAANGLGLLAAELETAVPPLVEALQSTNKGVRGFAAMRLAVVPFRPELTIPALTQALSDSDTNLSNTAAISLANMRANSAPLVAELRRLMAGTNAAVALTASNALHQLETTNSLPRGLRTER